MSGDAVALPRLQNRDGHDLTHLYCFGSYELGFIGRFTVFEQHGDYLAHTLPQFIERFTLRVGTGKPGNGADIETGFN